MKTFTFFCALMLALIATAQNNQSLLARYFDALATNRQFSGNVLIADHGKVVYEKSYGFADFTNKSPNTRNIRFPIASISKTLTATAILQLEEQGKLSVEDPVENYLRGFPYKTIKVKHLLSHTSGLPSYNTFFDSLKNAAPDRVFTNNDFMWGLIGTTKALRYEPGEKSNYDNINYVVLALIIEQLSGEAYADYIQKNVLDPAGMKNTVYFPLNFQYTTPMPVDFANPHFYQFPYDTLPIKAITVPFIRDYWHAYGFAGFGDYISTVHDLLLYDQAYYNHRLLKKESLLKTQTPFLLNNGKPAAASFGLGWEVEPDTSMGTIVYHGGAATGLSCVILRNLKTGQTVILFDNSHSNAQEIALEAMRILQGQPVALPKKSLAHVYGSVLLRYNAAVAKTFVLELKKDTINYVLSEDEINLLGYDFMNENNTYHLPEKHWYPQAAETFKLNMELFPNSWNVYDSYGESLLRLGRKEEAITLYKKSIELNPNNENGKRILAALQ